MKTQRGDGDDDDDDEEGRGARKAEKGRITLRRGGQHPTSGGASQKETANSHTIDHQHLNQPPMAPHPIATNHLLGDIFTFIQNQADV